MINGKKGFTLVELMVVVAIIGIISAIAYPSYDKYMKKSRRSDAKVALTKIVDREERYYLQNNTYTASFTALSLSTTSDEGYYTLTLAAPTPLTGYTATATAASGPQTGDTGCTVLTLDSAGVKTPPSCW